MAAAIGLDQTGQETISHPKKGFWAKDFFEIASNVIGLEGYPIGVRTVGWIKAQQVKYQIPPM